MTIRLLVRGTTLLVVLLGVLAMHGVAQHGSQVAAASTMSSADAGPAHHAGHAPHATGIPVQDPDHPGHTGALALCLAALGLLLATAARRVARGWPTTAASVTRRVALLPAPLTPVRPAQPPGPHTLMVMRC